MWLCSLYVHSNTSWCLLSRKIWPINTFRNCLPNICMFFYEDLKPGTRLTVESWPGSFLRFHNTRHLFLKIRTRIPMSVICWQDAVEPYIVRSNMTCTAHQIFGGWSNQEEWDGMGMRHVRKEKNVHRFGMGETWRKETILENIRVEGKIILKWIVNK